MEHSGYGNITFGQGNQLENSLNTDASRQIREHQDDSASESEILESSLILDDSLDQDSDAQNLNETASEFDHQTAILNQTADFRRPPPTMVTNFPPAALAEPLVVVEDINGERDTDDSIFRDEDLEVSEPSEASEEESPNKEHLKRVQEQYDRDITEFSKICSNVRETVDTDEVANYVEELEFIVNKQIEVVKMVSLQRYESEIFAYQQKLEVLEELARKQPEDYSKIGFYQQKVQSMKKIKDVLLKDWENIKAEIEDYIKNKPGELTRSQIDMFKRRLIIASSRLDSRLPIYLKKAEIVKSLETQRSTVIMGKPGCGKSTQLPNILFERNLISSEKKMFIVTPRQMSARQVFQRVSKELQDSGLVSGKSSGNYCHLINNADPKFNSSCPLIFCTDYEFYRRLVVLEDIKPKDIGYLVIDEANSRKMYTDMLISVARSLMKQNNDPKLVYLCTSFEDRRMNTFFSGLSSFSSDNIIEIAEKNYMTRLIYMPLNGDLEKQVSDILTEIEDMVHRQFKKNNSIKDANILMFMSNATEVWSMFRNFQWLNTCEGLMSGRLNLVKTEEQRDPSNQSKQRKVFKPVKPVYKLFMACGTNSPVFDEDLLVENNCEETIKLIFSTKVLETSLTVPGLGFVVDFGQETLYSFDYELGAQRKLKKDISKDTAEQREGRVGRTSKGVCFRIYKEEDFEVMEQSPDPELQYKNIDMVIMSMVYNALRKPAADKKTEYFDLNGVETERTDKRDFVDILTDIILEYRLWTELKPSTVKGSLKIFRDLSLIKKNILTEGPQRMFLAVIKFGQDPKIGLTLLQAIDLYKDKEKKDSWILTEVIDAAAASSNKTLPLDMNIQDEETVKVVEEASRLAAKYGGYAFNLHLFQYQMTQKKALKEIDDLSYKKFCETRKLLRLKVESFFPARDKPEFIYQPDEEMKHYCITYCMLRGFRVDISKFIKADLGYYHYRLEKPVKFDQRCPYGNDKKDSGIPKDEAPEFVIMSDVIAKDSVFEAKFCFPVKRSLLETRCSGLLEELDNIKLDKIPSEVYSRTDLSTLILEMLGFRMFYLEQILCKSGYVVDINSRSFTFKVAIRPDCYRETVQKIEALIDFLKESYKNFTFELSLPECRMMIGNSLMVYDVITHREGTATYFFKAPRFFVKKEGKLAISKECLNVEGRWDFLIHESRKEFGLTELGIEACFDTTFSKVNYAPDTSCMNIKLTCKTLKDSEKMKNKLQTVVDKWIADSGDLGAAELTPRLVHCQNHIARDLSCKPIQLKLLYSLAKGTGKATLKTKNIAAFGELETALKDLRANPDDQCILGQNFDFKSSSGKTGGFKLITLTNLPKHLDEITLLDYLKLQNEVIANARIDVEMEKEKVSEPSRDDLEKDVRSLLNRVILNYTQNEGLLNQFNLFIKEGTVRNYNMIKEAQIKISSDIVCKAIHEYLDKRYYAISDSPCYRLGRQYTNVQNFDKPEFPVKKREFTRFKGLLDTLNQLAESHLKEKHGATNKTKIDRDRVRIDYPSDDKLKRIKDDENVRIILYKGEDSELSNKIEMNLTEYIKGKEIHVREEYFSYFFSPEGDNFLRKTKVQIGNYCHISQVERKSILVVHELGDKAMKAIAEKCKELDERPTKTYFLKVTHKEYRDKIFIDKLKKSLTQTFKDIKVSAVVVHYPMIHIECDRKDLPAARDQMKAFAKGYFTASKENSSVSREICYICHDTANLRKLLFCGHVFCSGCLQNAFISQTAECFTEKVDRLNKAFFFCPKESCSSELACCDIFAFMADKLVEDVMSGIFNRLKGNGTLDKLGLVQCPGCKNFNRFEVSPTVETHCFGCQTHLPRPQAFK